MAMQAPANAPLVCHGHSRPINHLEYSNVTEDGVFLISSSKGADPPLGLSRGSTARDAPAAREDIAVRRRSRANAERTIKRQRPRFFLLTDFLLTDPTRPITPRTLFQTANP